MTIAARSWPIAIVKICRTVKRSRKENFVRLTEGKYFVGQKRQIRGDYKVDYFTFRGRITACGLNNFFYECEIQKWFSTLKFDLDALCWALQGNRKGPLCGFFRHVKARTVGALTRHLAIRA